MDAKDWIEALIRGLMCLLGILGNNWLGLRSLPGPKSHLRTNELLFINLAISNLITNYLVDLPDTMADFAGRWFLGEAYCGVFRFCSDVSETSSIFSTLFISVFWYQKLVGSLKRGGAPVQLDSLRLVAYLLAGSWTVAGVFSVPHFFFVQVDSGNESHKDCIEVFPSQTARQTYETLYLTLANALPIAGIVFSSIQIVITLLRNQMRIKGLTSDLHKGTDNALPNKREKMDSSRNQRISDIRPNLPGVSCSVLPCAGPSVVHSSISSPLYQVEVDDSRVRASPDRQRTSQPPAKLSPGSGTQVRAAKSVVAVATVFVVCWVTHLLLRISSNIHTSSVVVEVASYIASSYTCIIPYIFLYGVKKLSCSCRR
ncbi:rhodopsin-like [Salvelinus fontinalis]|uniref:rhodopsin-like n=1 Tax=Salvelinus fontinalis TaxID=8038 RepID=UPI0024860E49|nr:rhodopsin-like [Salvelinus fontinalis]